MVPAKPLVFGGADVARLFMVGEDSAFEFRNVATKLRYGFCAKPKAHP
jgi:hypothetical protein